MRGMSESQRLRFWPPPPETPEVKKEQIKLMAALVNALAIGCAITGFVGRLLPKSQTRT